jgi:hypothetical protein
MHYCVKLLISTDYIRESEVRLRQTETAQDDKDKKGALEHGVELLVTR